MEAGKGVRMGEHTVPEISEAENLVTHSISEMRNKQELKVLETTPPNG